MNKTISALILAASATTVHATTMTTCQVKDDTNGPSELSAVKITDTWKVSGEQTTIEVDLAQGLALQYKVVFSDGFVGMVALPLAPIPSNAPWFTDVLELSMPEGSPAGTSLLKAGQLVGPRNYLGKYRGYELTCDKGVSLP